MSPLPSPIRAARTTGSGRATRPDFPVLAAKGLTKRFFGVTVLEGVSLHLAPGEVRALLGENGAGKSTLINLLSGVHQPEEGALQLDGQPVVFQRPLDADHAGISVIRQELSLFPDLSVAEAIFAGHLPTRRFGRVDWARIRRESQAALDRLGVRIDVRDRVDRLSVAEQQLVEIARALTRQSRVVIMDEPTAALSPGEVERLGTIIAQLSAAGVAVLYVSHRLEEIKQFCQSFTVLRDGRVVAEGRVDAVSKEQLIRAMAGRDITLAPASAAVPLGETRLLLRNLASAPGTGQRAKVRDVSFSLKAGEILGLAGIVGAGRTEIARMIFGLDPIGSGQITLAGRAHAPSGPAAAMQAGVGLVPEDRKGQSILPARSLLENFALAGAIKPRAVGLIDKPAEAAAFAGYMRDLAIKSAGPEAAIATLSGGNQQKVILARWLARKPRLLIVDEPTRGIDVGAKEDVHRLLRQIAESGTAVLLISSDLPEVLSLSHRIVTICEGVSTADLPSAGATQERLMALMTPQTDPMTFPTTDLCR